MVRIALEIHILSLHDALPIFGGCYSCFERLMIKNLSYCPSMTTRNMANRSEEHTSELQSRGHLVCRLLLVIKNRRYEFPQHHLRRIRCLLIRIVLAILSEDLE